MNVFSSFRWFWGCVERVWDFSLLRNFGFGRPNRTRMFGAFWKWTSRGDNFLKPVCTSTKSFSRNGWYLLVFSFCANLFKGAKKIMLEGIFTYSFIHLFRIREGFVVGIGFLGFAIFDDLFKFPLLVKFDWSG